MTAKSLHSLRATYEVVGENSSRRTGRVAVWAVPGWLKREAYASASITPRQARLLAIELLTAAEKAEQVAPR